MPHFIFLIITALSFPILVDANVNQVLTFNTKASTAGFVTPVWSELDPNGKVRLQIATGRSFEHPARELVLHDPKKVYRSGFLIGYDGARLLDDKHQWLVKEVDFQVPHRERQTAWMLNSIGLPLFVLLLFPILRFIRQTTIYQAMICAQIPSHIALIISYCFRLIVSGSYWVFGWWLGRCNRTVDDYSGIHRRQFYPHTLRSNCLVDFSGGFLLLYDRWVGASGRGGWYGAPMADSVCIVPVVLRRSPWLWVRLAAWPPAFWLVFMLPRFHRVSYPCWSVYWG